MPTEIRRISDFPLGDTKDPMEKDDVVTVEFSRTYDGHWFKTKKLLMSHTRFSKLLKETGAKPEWQVLAVETTPDGREVKDDNGKPKKKMYDCVEPTKTNLNQKAI